jgi:membrane protease YdiL (CAAX protease family)
MHTQKAAENTGNVNWKSVLVYYGLACALSWPFFWWRDIHHDSWQRWAVPAFIKTWSYMWGPGLSAIICFFLFRKSHSRTITLLGTSVAKSLAFYFIPIAALAIVGLRGADSLASHLSPILFSAIGFISILGEELGWRGFLQDALRPMNPVKKYLLIGVMWEFWHFTTRTTHGGLLQIMARVGIFLSVVIVLAFLIGKAAEKSKSVTVAVTLHAWFDMLFEFGAWQTYLVFALSVPFWIYMLSAWNKKRRSSVKIPARSM